MAFEFRMIHRVEFAETDMAGIVHFANYFRLMEETEHAFIRSLGLSIHMTDEGRTISWPRVNAHCDYFSPLRFEDEVEVHLTVKEKKRASLTYDFSFRKAGADELVARGSITVVCVAMDKQLGKMKAVTMPDAFSSQIEAAPAQ
jgi:acyl-CoA thioester hydrolase